jgi:hypothetical protein
MRRSAWLRLLSIAFAVIAVSATRPTRADDAIPYAVLGEMAAGAAQGYMVEVAPPGYPGVRLYAEETGRGN